MSQIQYATKNKLPELNIVRALAIIGVLCVHATSLSVITGIKYSDWFVLYNFANIFMKFGTTTFIFLSSFVLYYNYYDRPMTAALMKSFYKKRITFILVPYIVFSCFYYVIKSIINQPDFTFWQYTGDFLNDLLYGDAYEHLYFVCINIQFYLMFPLFLMLFKKYPALTKWLVIIGLVIQWTFFIVNKNLETPVANRGSWSLSYFSYYLLGAYLGIHFDKWKGWFQSKKDNRKKIVISGVVLAWLATGLFHVTMWFRLRRRTDTYSTMLFDQVWNAYTLLSIIVLMLLSFWLYRTLGGKVLQLVTRLGQVSFGVYLIHPFILFVYRYYPPTTSTMLYHHLWFAGGFVLAFLGSWLIVELVVRYLPKSWIVFGSIKPLVSKNKKAEIKGATISSVEKNVQV